MPRALVLMTLCGGCLVPNPQWSGSDEGAGDGTMGVPATGSDSDTGLLDGTGDSETTETGGSMNEEGYCPGPDPLPNDGVVSVEPDAGWAGIQAAINEAGPSGTVALAPGTYVAEETSLRIETPNLTLTSVSRNAEDTGLRGTGDFPLLLSIAADNVTISDLTFAAADVAIRIGGPSDVTASTTVTRVRFSDVSNGIESSEGVAASRFVDGTEVSCSTFIITGDRGSGPECTGFRAIENRSGRNWHVRDNVFEGYFCRDTMTFPPAIHFTAGSMGALIERNRFLDVYRPILLGGEDVIDGMEPPRPLGDTPCAETYWGHVGGSVVNNLLWNGGPEFIAAPPGEDAAITFYKACQSVAHHNTVVALGDGTGYSGIQLHHVDSDVKVKNNLMTTNLREVSDAVFSARMGNIELATLTEFVDAERGDLHLVPNATAIDAGIALQSVRRDFDGHVRSEPPDVGAYEYVP